MKQYRFIIHILAIAWFSVYGLLAQDIIPGNDRATLLAREEFRRGVQAYHRFSYNEAILSLEKALSYKSEEAIILDWLGRSYYRSGLENTALARWREAAARYDADSAEAIVLGGRIEAVRNRRALIFDLETGSSFVEAGRYPGTNDDITLFRQPSGVLPNSDGSVWVVAYGSNELVRLDVNGIVRARVRGPLVGFDRPYDIARSNDGRLFVSEYRGNRVSVLRPDGSWLASFGTKGRGEGQFVGPQNLTVSSDGYLYVVDFGNKRVQKFSGDGAFILSFGAKGKGFSGFIAPTGIAANGDSVFVADAGAGHIARFDQSGNFIAFLAEEGLEYPESLRFDTMGRLLVADTTRIVLVDPESGYLQEISDLGGASVRIVSADIGVNGDIFAANFASGDIEVLAKIDDIASGLFVQIDRVISDKFPLVTVELSVQDRNRRPIVGLENRNFVLREHTLPVQNQSFIGSGDSAADAAIVVLAERSERTAGYRSAIKSAVADLAERAAIAAIVSAAEQPLLDDRAAGGESEAAYGPYWRFDLGLRLAAGELMSLSKRRSIVFIGSGRLGDKAFERYGVSDLAAYLANNGIVFNVALVGDGQAATELLYMCEQTGGQVLRVYDPRGVAPLVEALTAKTIGTYSLSYVSSAPTDFGRAYLDLSAEAYVLNRSGRDLSGYFAPLE